MEIAAPKHNKHSILSSQKRVSSMIQIFHSLERQLVKDGILDSRLFLDPMLHSRLSRSRKASPGHGEMLTP